MSGAARKKIAILGGGPAGLAAAYRLTEKAPGEYDITVYQMGWRVGGKGTSGYRRWQPPGGGEAIWNRIEEHGLHILFGFYTNFFAVMRQCYAELARPDQHPLGSFEKAFEPRDFGTTMYRHRSRWRRAHVWFRRDDAAPDADDAIRAGDTLDSLAAFLASSFRNAFRPFGNPNAPPAPTQRAFDVAGGVAFAVARRVLRALAARPSWGLRVLRFWQRHVRRWLRPILGRFGRTYLLWLGVDYFVALCVGVLEADILKIRAIESLDRLEYREWLEQSGIHPETAVSPFVSLIYHAAFSYERGEPGRPRIAAGSALRLVLRAAVEGRGAAYNRMRGGMGEVVFVPLYETLRRRGVRFEFFHKVEALHLDATRQQVEEIEILRQARLAPERSAYEPLITVKGVEAFPSEPLWDQLENGEALRDLRFESYYQPEASLPTGERRRLKRGRDFDQVVLATPVATLPYVAAELLEESEPWREMVAHVKSVQTLSLQVWFDESLPQLGWDQPDPQDPHTLLSMYAMPMSTWVPMDQTLPRENWPIGMEPRSVSYFTGVQPGPEVAPRPSERPRFPEEQATEARILSESFVRNLLAEDLLEKLEDRANPPFPRFEALHDPHGREGSERLAAQLYRSNCEPSERVTLALPGATKFRLEAGDTGFANLVIAGDWIDNGVQLACMEGAFTGGLQAGDAILLSKAPAPG